MTWEWITHYEDGRKAAAPWLAGKFKAGIIYIEQRPYYCDRGDWVAKLEMCFDEKIPATHLDGADGWPRYYFNLDRAKEELEAWINKRGLML